MHGAIPPFPQYVFMAWCLVKNKDNFVKEKLTQTPYTHTHTQTFHNHESLKIYI